LEQRTTCPAQTLTDGGRSAAEWPIGAPGVASLANGFADLVGRSVSWVDKIESGERALLRLPLLEQVAEVLHVAVETLTDKTAADRAATCVDPAEVQAIRAALSKYPGLSAQGTEVVPVSAIRSQADYLEHAWLASRFTVVAGHRPLAHSLLRTLLDKTRGSSAQLVKQMATRAGVNA
jgi:transcriptional regulator with XRE-family HTH domain